MLVVCGYLGDKYGNRILISSSGLLIAMTGVALIVGLPLDNNSGRLGGYYMTQASPTPFVAFLSLISTNVVRVTAVNVETTTYLLQAGYTKKTTVAAMYLIAYCVGSKSCHIQLIYSRH